MDSYRAEGAWDSVGSARSSTQAEENSASNSVSASGQFFRMGGGAKDAIEIFGQDMARGWITNSACILFAATRLPRTVIMEWKKRRSIVCSLQCSK